MPNKLGNSVFAIPCCVPTVRRSVCGVVSEREDFSFVSFSFGLSKENEKETAAAANFIADKPFLRKKN